MSIDGHDLAKSAKAWHATMRAGKGKSTLDTSEVFKHGGGGYENHGCRCDVCRAANTKRSSRVRAKAKETPAEMLKRVMGS